MSTDFEPQDVGREPTGRESTGSSHGVKPSISRGGRRAEPRRRVMPNRPIFRVHEKACKSVRKFSFPTGRLLACRLRPDWRLKRLTS